MRNAILIVLLLTGVCTANAKRKPHPTPRPTPSPTPVPTLVSASIEWTSVTSATGYRLYYGRGSRTYPQIVTVNDTTYRVNGLTRGIRYFFAVKAFNGSGSSVYSVEKTYTPQ